MRRDKSYFGPRHDSPFFIAAGCSCSCLAALRFVSTFPRLQHTFTHALAKVPLPQVLYSANYNAHMRM